MQEERMMILKMLEEGKINSDQAQELLAALEFSDSEGHSAPYRLSTDAGEEEGGRLVDSAEPGSPEEVEEDTAAKSLEKLDQLVPSLLEGLLGGLGMFGSGHKFEEEHEGEFSSEAERVQIEMKSVNGSLEVRGWDRPGYRLTVKTTVRASSREKAKEKADEAVELIQESDRLKAAIRPGVTGLGVRMELCLPAEHNYLLDLGTSNGRIEVNDLRADDVHAATSNGRVVVTGSRVGSARLTTSNGRIVAMGVSGDLKARTSNGRIEASIQEPDGGEHQVDLKTSNGKIVVGLADSSRHGYRLQASTSSGKIILELPDMEIEEGKAREQSGVSVFQHKMAVRSRDLEQMSSVSRIRAATTNGTVRFTSES